MPLDLSVFGERVRLTSASSPLYFNKTFAYVLISLLNLEVKLKALWRWASNEAAGVDTLEVVVADLHTGGSGLMVAFVLTEAAGNSAST